MGAIGALNGVVEGVDVNVGGPGGLLATDDTVEVGGRLTVGGVILLSDFFRFRPVMGKKQTMFRKDLHDFFFELNLNLFA